MAKVELHLEPGETEEEVQEMLIKAFQHHAAGKEHKEAFHEPAARDVFNYMINQHDKTWAKILQEVSVVLDEEV
jgi:hypothetical protein